MMFATFDAVCGKKKQKKKKKGEKNDTLQSVKQHDNTTGAKL